MKQKQKPFYTTTKTPLLHSAIAAHCVTPFVQSARFVTDHYEYLGHRGPGLVSCVRRRYHPHFDRGRDNMSKAHKRRWKSVKVRGSNSSQGKTVDNQIAKYTQAGGGSISAVLGSRVSPLTRALLEYFKGIGHTPQAAQLPVRLADWEGMTQADLITKDSFGNLWLWEVKTGFPVGGFRHHDTFHNIGGGKKDKVPCTIYNCWQLQLYFTRRALERTAKLPISQARVIQVYTEKGKVKPIIKVHETPKWLRDIVIPL